MQTLFIVNKRENIMNDICKKYRIRQFSNRYYNTPQWVNNVRTSCHANSIHVQYNDIDLGVCIIINHNNSYMLGSGYSIDYSVAFRHVRIMMKHQRGT